ncbi:hypothetical protein [Paractinoplanes brasiliensis]|uniref:Uncharacterized protein n=1 Tax=Paractinoplanes brasiliensis TaxID=52695 RepID=A0A4R6JAG5_9ACTN|nr:hypothetical protein [Actinoplanes brasiliensis]TDO31455.1 hypothetical protein C8E87_6879 [Actinoplanes brasiliensis]GID30851.1 hypothetical protein Abr02nite_58340 [Actinoplanes brasiliensis]
MTSPGLLGWGDVAIGAVVRTRENAVLVAERLRARVGSWEAGASGLRERLAERGAIERGRVTTAGSRMLDQLIDIPLERVLRLLENEPDRIRVLVRGQRETIVEEVVGRVRSSATAGDEAVDRLTLRMGRRAPTDSR